MRGLVPWHRRGGCSASRDDGQHSAANCIGQRPTGNLAGQSAGACGWPAPGLWLGTLLIVAGCQAPPIDSVRATMVSRSQRELAMQTAWRGRPYPALVEAWGQPRLRLEIPGDRPREWVAVFDTVDSTSSCIDAFTVLRAEVPTVLDYFCR